MKSQLVLQNQSIYTEIKNESNWLNHDYKFIADGLRILAFPCNQFGYQEPGTSEDIKNFVAKYGVEFDMFEKINVNGNDAHPLFNYLKEKQAGTMFNFIKWNFTKFVINKDGQPVARFSPGDNPIPAVSDLCKTLY